MPDNFNDLFAKNGAKVHRVAPHGGSYFDSHGTEPPAGREYILGPNEDGQYGRLTIEPTAGGWCHGGSFDADGDWPEVGDTIFAYETDYGSNGDHEWSSVRIQSSRGDMRAMVRDYGDAHDYGAGLYTEFRRIDPQFFVAVLQCEDGVHYVEGRYLDATDAVLRAIAIWKERGHKVVKLLTVTKQTHTEYNYELVDAALAA